MIATVAATLAGCCLQVNGFLPEVIAIQKIPGLRRIHCLTSQKEPLCSSYLSFELKCSPFSPYSSNAERFEGYLFEKKTLTSPKFGRNFQVSFTVSCITTLLSFERIPFFLCRTSGIPDGSDIFRFRYCRMPSSALCRSGAEFVQSVEWTISDDASHVNVSWYRLTWIATPCSLRSGLCLCFPLLPEVSAGFPAALLNLLLWSHAKPSQKIHFHFTCSIKPASLSESITFSDSLSGLDLNALPFRISFSSETGHHYPIRWIKITTNNLMKSRIWVFISKHITNLRY